MSAPSILFDRAEDGPSGAGAPECFHDLRLDEIVASITAGRAEYELAPFFYTPLRTVEAIRYRQEVFRDLEETPALARQVAAFGAAMRAVREHLARAEKGYYPLQRQRWFLDAVSLYGDAVTRLAGALEAAPLHSRGLCAFREVLGAYLRSEQCSALREDTRRVADGLAAIRYDLEIDGRRIEVRARRGDEPGGELDYGAEVARTLAKFEQPGGREYRFRLHDLPEMNHVEAAILERVALLFPEEFAALAAFCAAHRDALEPAVLRFDREAQFYLACLEHASRLSSAGLECCHPEVTDGPRDVRGEAMFDLALADALVAGGKPVVTNDFSLAGPERVLVVTGANQGGKTTFARALGQLHYLAALGCPVPARRVRLQLCDAIYTHFEREEAVETLTGKLEDELLRMRRILEAATPRSLLVMNESFGSTTLSDALFVATRVLERIIERGMLCVCVTFLEELASLGAATVSLVSQVAPDDPAVRTFKVIRQPPDGLAHAAAIARKYRLSYDEVRARLAERAGADPTSSMAPLKAHS